MLGFKDVTKILAFRDDGGGGGGGGGGCGSIFGLAIFIVMFDVS